MKKMKFVMTLLLCPLFCLAWNGVGHSAGGAIAYYYLKQHNPAVMTKVIEALKSHPWYNDQKHWAAKLDGLSGDEKKVTMFMLASTFPDEARSDKDLGGGEKPKWHFVDYPFVPNGNTTTGNQPESPNAREKITEIIASAKSENDPAQLALDICWIFHLIEDIHQPLHTSCLYTDDHLEGDRGGNNTYFLLPNNDKPWKLHSYWDGLIKSKNIPATAQALLAKPIYKESKLTELTTNTTVEDWILKESFPMAKEVAYDNGNVIGTEDSPTEVDASYDAKAKKAGERRIVLAGIRVAWKLSEIFE